MRFATNQFVSNHYIDALSNPSMRSSAVVHPPMENEALEISDIDTDVTYEDHIG
jgi:hypothetical protein